MRRKIQFHAEENPVSSEEIENPHRGTDKLFGTSKSFFRSFISFFRTFISRLPGECSFSSQLFADSSVGIIIRHHEVTTLVASYPYFYKDFSLLGLEAL